MARIDIRGAHVEFPIYNVSTRSFKKQFIRLATGGAISADAKQHIVVSALNNINLTLTHGDRVGVIGHNGAGKSTLLRLLAGIYEPTKGDINIQGSVSAMLDIMQGMEAEFTGYENITIRGTLLGLSPKQIRQKIQEIVSLTGLGDYLAMPVRTYSSGMMVRLAFAVSACISPDILLIDEVFAAGDADFVQTAQKKMVSLLEQSSIVVMANHSDGIIQDFCNKGLLMNGGQIIYFGSVEEAFKIYYQTGTKHDYN